MQVLVIGGFGLIGGRLSRYLHDQGHYIILGSRSVRLPPTWLKRGKIAHIDLDDHKSIENSLCNVDVVIFASGMSAIECEKYPEIAIDKKEIQLGNFLIASEKFNLKRIVYISSAHVYCRPLVGIITEDTHLNNTHPYALSHLTGERILSKSNSKVLILRIANGFGAPVDLNHQCWELLVNDLCRQVVLKNRITLRTNGLQERCFVTLSEICRVIKLLIEADQEENLILNIGSDKAISVLKMAELVGKRAKILFNLSIDIEVPKGGNNYNYPGLDFQSKNLKKIGIQINANYQDEIDELLYYCKNNS